MQRPPVQLLGGTVRTLGRVNYRHCPTATDAVSSQWDHVVVPVRRHASLPSLRPHSGGLCLSQPSRHKGTKPGPDRDQEFFGVKEPPQKQQGATRETVPVTERNALGKFYDWTAEQYRELRPRLAPAVSSVRQSLQSTSRAVSPHVQAAATAIKPRVTAAAQTVVSSARPTFNTVREHPRAVVGVSGGLLALFAGYTYFRRKGPEKNASNMKVKIPGDRKAAMAAAGVTSPQCESCSARLGEDEVYRAALKNLVKDEIPSLLEDLRQERSKLREAAKASKA